jgi:hypothetical protein
MRVYFRSCDHPSRRPLRVSTGAEHYQSCVDYVLDKNSTEEFENALRIGEVAWPDSEGLRESPQQHSFQFPHPLHKLYDERGIAAWPHQTL